MEVLSNEKITLGIVTVVGFIAIIGLLLSGFGSNSLDITGHAVKASSSIKTTKIAPVCSDTDGGLELKKNGVVSFSTETTTYPDSCVGDSPKENYLYEYYCSGSAAKVKQYNCYEELGREYSCKDNTCTITNLGGEFYGKTETFKTNDGSSRELLFALEKFDLRETTTYYSGILEHGATFSSLWEDSDDNRKATHLEFAWFGYDFDSDNVFLDLTKNFPTDLEYVKFDEIVPKKWLVVSLSAKVDSAHTSDHASLLSQPTNECGNPYYAITTEDGKYHFIISVAGKKYTLDSSTKVNSNWQDVMGTYDGEMIELWVDGELEDWEEASGNINPDGNPKSKALTLGYSTVCDDLDYEGFLDSVYIWGE